MARLLSRKFFSLSRCWRNIFHALRKNSPCQTHKRSNNVLASTDRARCHPRVQTHAGQGDGPSAGSTGFWSGVLGFVELSRFLSSTPAFHTGSNATSLFDNVSMEYKHFGEVKASLKSPETSQTRRCEGNKRANQNRSDPSLCPLAAASRGLVLSLMFQ